MKKAAHSQASPAKSNSSAGWQISPPAPWIRGAQLLALAALGVSVFLLWGSLTGDKLPGCGEQSGCSAVMRSRWAYIFGLPVSLPAIGMYLGTLVGLYLFPRAQTHLAQERAAKLLIFAAATILSAAVWFIVLQLFVIHAICPFCMVAHSCGGLMGVLLMAKIPNSLRAGESSAMKPNWGVIIAVGIGAVVFLAAGQAMHQPKTFVVDSTASTAASTNSISHASTNAATSATLMPNGSSMTNQPAAAPEHRVMRLYGDEFALDLEEVPIMGNPQAPRMGVELFDYSCHYCRQLHSVLLEACRRWSNDLAIISLPMPMDVKCNPCIRRQLPDHTNACEYARIGLAVWRAQRQKLPEYEAWFFAPQQPPAPAIAQAEAMRLVGSNALVKALADPWVEKQLQFNTSIYGTNRLRYKKTNLPQLVLGTNLVTGVISANELARIYTNQFNPVQ